MIENKKALAENESQNKFPKNIIPQNLRNACRFVGYDKNKRPINPATGANASVTDKNTWSDFNTVISSMAKYPHIVGVGIVLGAFEGQKLCGLDIDNCIDTNGKISKEAQEIIDCLKTYTELSPSGTGIHSLFFAEKLGNKCKNSTLEGCKCLELYDTNRYFTLTGNCLNDKDIEYRQKECDIIYQKYFEATTEKEVSLKIMPSKTDEARLKVGLVKDPKLRAYYYGQRFFPDESSNDNGFMSKLMFWTNNNTTLAIEAFLGSPYAQAKDDLHKRKLLRKDYLQRTAERCRHSVLRGAYGQL